MPTIELICDSDVSDQQTFYSLGFLGYVPNGMCALSDASPFCDTDGGICLQSNHPATGFDVYRSHCGLCNDLDQCDTNVQSPSVGFNTDGECRSGSCVACTQAGSPTTCSVDDDCCAGAYCSRGKNQELPASAWHCCLEGEYWDQSIKSCRETTECKPDPCLPDQFTPGWWADSNCVSASGACCQVGPKYGMDPYYDTKYADRRPCLEDY